MDQDQATDIRFFDTISRIGRVRYLAYGWVLGMFVLPLTFIALYLILKGSQLSGLAILTALWLVSTPIHFSFMIRRLHDMDHSGWWSLLYVPAALSSIIRFLDTLQHSHTHSLAHLSAGLLGLGLAAMLLFAPGTEGGNRFGPKPPQNSPGVIAVAWSLLALPVIFILGVLLLMPLIKVGMDKTRASELVNATRAQIYPAMRYLRENHALPVDPASLGGSTDNVTILTYTDGSYGIVMMSRRIRSEQVEVWTTDNGENWHCGLPSYSTIAADDMPEDCRENPPPER